jgi:diguanylate cyclase (GGDEF)-like protein
MPSSGAPTPFRLPAEDSYLELLADTLDDLELPARAQFLQRYFRAIANLDLSDTQCLHLWDQILATRRELAERLDRPVALKTALLDVFSSSGLLRVPIIIEYDELKHLRISAVTDALTGLYNRRLFSESLEKELNRAKRYGHAFGLVILDLHKFKEVNDRHGHPRGDEVLRIAATTLRKALRTSDSAFRIGGDEFAVLLPQTDGSQAHAFGRRISAVFEEGLSPLRLMVDVGFDYGVATYPQDADDPQQLIQLADERLYHLKHANHGRPAEEPPAKEPSEGTPATDKTEKSESTERPSPPKPISIDYIRAEKTAEAPSAPPVDSGAAETAARPRSTMESAASASASAMSGSAAASPEEPASRTYAVQRKAERVSMSGTNAYAVLGENGTRRARVLDLGFGGVALEMDSAEVIAENTLAILHVPILPPVRVNLRPVWSQKTPQGTQRLGCAFVS